VTRPDRLVRSQWNCHCHENKDNQTAHGCDLIKPKYPPIANRVPARGCVARGSAVRYHLDCQPFCASSGGFAQPMPLADETVERVGAILAASLAMDTPWAFTGLPFAKPANPASL
jgi:hypothetical protein